MVMHWVVSVVVALIVYLPWWPVVVSILRQRLALWGMQSVAGVGSPLTFAVQAIDSLGPATGWSAWLWLAMWAVGLSSLARRRPHLSVLAGLWLALPLVLSVAFRDPRAQHMRYAFLLPVYLILVAEGAAGIVRLACNLHSTSARSGVQPSGCPTLGRLKPALRVGLPPWAVSAAVLVAINVLYLPATYRQAKTGWREAAAYLDERTRPGDVIVTDPLFDAGRYLDYYYSGPAELTTPAVLVASLPARARGMRASGGRVWAVTRFVPRPLAAIRPVEFPGLVISEPLIPVYEPEPLTAAMIDLMQQAVEAAPGWAARMSAEGTMDPDPRVARAAAYLFLGDVLRVAGRLPEATAAYEAMVSDDPDAAAGHAILAEAYQATGRNEAAVRAYQRAVALQPKWQGPRAEAAAALAEAGEWAEAAAAYQAIVQPREP